MFQRQVDGHDERTGRDAGDDDQQRRGGQRHREVGQQGDTFFLNNITTVYFIVKLRQGSGKDLQGMAVKAKGHKA